MKKLLFFLSLSLVAIYCAFPSMILANQDHETEKAFLVKDAQGHLIGTASKVLENIAGNADFLIISLENVPKREILVPFSAISVSENETIIVNLTPETLAKAPTYDRFEMSDLRSVNKLYLYYGMTPPWNE